MERLERENLEAQDLGQQFQASKYELEDSESKRHHDDETSNSFII